MLGVKERVFAPLPPVSVEALVPPDHFYRHLDRVRGYHATEVFAKAMRKRKVWSEPLFAEAKDWHELRRFQLRGWPKVNGEALLIAAGQNLKRLLSRCGWGRRPCPTGSVGLALPAAPPGRRLARGTETRLRRHDAGSLRVTLHPGLFQQAGRFLKLVAS